MLKLLWWGENVVEIDVQRRERMDDGKIPGGILCSTARARE